MNKYINTLQVGPSEERVKVIYSKYVKYFLGSKKVLDVGCGRGIFLEMLQKSGIQAYGIDEEKEMIDICKKKGFKVFHVEALSFLNYKKEEYDGVFIGHLIEHFYPEDALKLISYSYNTLIKGGVIVVITPNIEDLEVITRRFWMDLSHKRPYPLPLLEKMLGYTGFKIIKRGEGTDNLLKSHSIKRKIFEYPLTYFKRLIIGNSWGRGDNYIIGRKPKNVKT